MATICSEDVFLLAQEAAGLLATSQPARRAYADCFDDWIFADDFASGWPLFRMGGFLRVSGDSHARSSTPVERLLVLKAARRGRRARCRSARASVAYSAHAARDFSPFHDTSVSRRRGGSAFRRFFIAFASRLRPPARLILNAARPTSRAHY